jgi:hypothetical protein
MDKFMVDISHHLINDFAFHHSLCGYLVCKYTFIFKKAAFSLFIYLGPISSEIDKNPAEVICQ